MIKICSKPQQISAATPTPLAHRSHSCMRALALGYDSQTTPTHYVIHEQLASIHSLLFSSATTYQTSHWNIGGCTTHFLLQHTIQKCTHDSYAYRF